MENKQYYMDYLLDILKKVLAIDSPSGYTQEVAEFVVKEYKSLGFTSFITTKGGVIAELGGANKDKGIVMAAHIDTLGAMVHEIKGSGRLKAVNIGGLKANSIEGENCKVLTRFDGIYEGTFQLQNASLHVNDDFSGVARSYDTLEIVLDEFVNNKNEVEALGICAGDMVFVDPRTRITSKGFIKSRFLDDKLSVAILLTYAKYIAEEKVSLERATYHYITVYEEVGHGCASSIPEGVTEILCVDMGCVGDGLNCKEHQVSICAKDSKSPYNYELVTNLVKAAKEHDVDYAVDIYPHYGSDVDVALSAGYEIKHALIGPGVYASHGYERSHVDGAYNTLKLLMGYNG
ncbi:MAG: M42 family metallopeptidase [Lachnospiraceae bacterium]